MSGFQSPGFGDNLSNKQIRQAKLVQGGSIIKQGDDFTLGFRLYDANNNVVTPGQSETIIVKTHNRYGLHEFNATVSGDTVQFTVDEDIGYGQTHVEIKTDLNGQTKRYPAKGWIVLNITPSLDNIEVGGIPVVTVTQMQNEIQTAVEKSDEALDKTNQTRAEMESLIMSADPTISDQLKVGDGGTVYSSPQERLLQERQQVTDRLAETVKREEGGIITPVMLSQETKEQMTGGSVAVVGVNAVLEENIVDNQVTPKKVTFLETGKNLLNPDATTLGYTLSPSTGAPVASATYRISEFIPVLSGEKFAINNPRYVAFYNTSQGFLQPSFVDNGGHPPVVVTAPENGYMRIAISPTYFDTIQIERGEIHTPPEDFGHKLKRWINPNEQAISDLSEKVNIIERTKNLHNYDTDTVGEYIGHTDGILRASSKYRTTDFIPITAGTTYVIDNCRKLAIFSISQTFVSGVDVNPQAEYSFTADNNGYVRFSYDTDLLAIDRAQMEIGSVSTEFEESGMKIDELVFTQKQIDQVLQGQSGTENVLSGKKLLGFGDSIAQGGGNGGDSYIEMVAQDNGMIFNNRAVGGSTIAPRAGYDNEIIKQINAAITASEQADYIVFNGLTNDANVLAVENAGTISTGYNATLDLNTFCGAFENTVKTLILNWTNAKIVYVRVHNMDSRDSRQVTYGDLALEICKKWSIPVVNMFHEGGMNTQIPELKLLYTDENDGTHPNDAGYRKFYAPRVEAKLKSI